MNTQSILEALEFAPKESSTQPPPMLRGWWLPGDDGIYYVCCHCASRMLDRGVSLGRAAEPVWSDRPEPYGQCCGCQP